jgi:hypothetical protein
MCTPHAMWLSHTEIRCKYVSARISDCPPPFAHSMNVIGNSPLTVGREGVPDYVVDVPLDVSGD